MPASTPGNYLRKSFKISKNIGKLPMRNVAQEEVRGDGMTRRAARSGSGAVTNPLQIRYYDPASIVAI